MKKIINGKMYNTETARLIAESSWGTIGDFSYCEEVLYLKRTGEFFLYGSGGALSKYAKHRGNDSWGSSEIVLLSQDEAKAWLEANDHTEAYERTFGALADEPFDEVKYKNEYAAENYDRILVALPKGYRDKVRTAALGHGISMTEFIKRAIDEKL